MIKQILNTYILGILFLAGMLITSCHEELNKEIVEKFDNGNIKTAHFYKETPSGKTLAKEIQYYPNGQKRIEGNIVEGNRDGKWTFWFEHGAVWSTGYYTKGVRTGATLVYHENGALFYEGTYKDGNKHGTWKFYDEEGTLVNQVEFENGKLKEQTGNTDSSIP